MDFVVQNAFWFTVLVVSASGLVWIGLQGDRGGVSHQDAVIMMNRDHATVIDVREASEFAAEHLPGARNPPLDHIELGGGDVDKLKKKTCILYCSRGNRAAKAQKALVAKGFENVHVLSGGIEAWREAGLPVERANA